MDALKNTGFLVLGESTAAEEKPRTLVILGVSRGGTSATAGILGQLGVFMGNSGEPPMYEDLFLNRAVTSGDDASFTGRIADYNQRYPVWGFKGTILNRDLARYHALFRHPRYLIVFRDVLATAMRSSLAAGHAVDAVVARQLNEYGRILQFLQQADPHSLLMSYEKLVMEPRPIVEAVAEFAGITPGATELDRVLRFLQGPRDSYFATSRLRDS